MNTNNTYLAPRWYHIITLLNKKETDQIMPN